eukprot:2101818-Amphidinium_carterae.2
MSLRLCVQFTEVTCQKVLESSNGDGVFVKGQLEGPAATRRVEPFSQRIMLILQAILAESGVFGPQNSN